MREAKFQKALTMALRVEVYDRLKAVADERRISIAEVVREIMDNYFNTQHKEDK